MIGREQSTRYLLDVNALIAAIWINHPDHKKADAWLQGKQVVTCPLSELGFLRISTNPKALKSDMHSARRLLEAFLQQQEAGFLPADLPALKSNAQKSDQVTDHYLAELASNSGMKLATLDAGISHSAAELMV
jgi:toxin-antitoxin system PIN domain toxin